VKGPLVNDFIVIPAFAGMTNKSEFPQVDKYYFSPLWRHLPDLPVLIIANSLTNAVKVN